MNNFDSTLRPFKHYDNGKVVVSELVEALAEFELKTDLQAVKSAVLKIEKARFSRRSAVMDTHSGKLRPPAVQIPAELQKAHKQLNTRASFWTTALYRASQKAGWLLFSFNGAKLFEEPPSEAEFQLTAVSLSDVISWLDATSQSELALAVASKRDVTTNRLLRLVGSNVQEQRNAAKESIAWPWGRHNTKLLEVLAATAEEFWSLYNPLDETTHVLKEDVVKWIMKWHGDKVSAHMANAIATILRADGLPTGRPRKSTIE